MFDLFPTQYLIFLRLLFFLSFSFILFRCGSMQAAAGRPAGRSVSRRWYSRSPSNHYLPVCFCSPGYIMFPTSISHFAGSFYADFPCGFRCSRDPVLSKRHDDAFRIVKLGTDSPNKKILHRGRMALFVLDRMQQDRHAKAICFRNSRGRNQITEKLINNLISDT